MTTNKKYLALFLVAALVVAGTSLSTGVSAQTTNLRCSVGSATVGRNQQVILTATGGDGAYFWSGPNLNIGDPTGNQFAVSYPDPGDYTIRVSSGGQNATCSFSVVLADSNNGLFCSPPVQNVMLGQNASFTASGGDGAYTWSSPDLNINETHGSGFTANYGSAGLKTLTVRSNNLTATCAVNVLSNRVVPTPVPVTPGFPNTGGGYGL